MFDRVRATSRSPRRVQKPHIENLEGRQLLTATLEPIGNLSVPVNLGYQVPLDGGTGAPQTYDVASSNPDIKASVAQGKFLTFNVSHTSSGAGDPSFTGSMTFQLFDDLTPLTTQRIEMLVQQGFYTGKNLHRIAPNFPGPNDFIVQGGSVSGTGTGEVNEPGFPFRDEFVQQVAFTGTGQLAMANAGDDTNSSQFFVTTGSPRFLDFQHTIFGQLVSGQPTLQQITQVKKGTDGTTPASPVIIDSAMLADTSPDGVIHIDTTSATAGESSNVTVTTFEPSTNTTATRTFTVNVTPNVDSSGMPINERPFLQPVQNQVVGLINAAGQTVQGQTDVFKLQGVDANPGDQLTYIVKGGVTTGTSPSFTDVQNATATVDANGVVSVVPKAGFTGVINLLVGVRDQVNRAGGSSLDDPGNFDTQMMTLTVTNGQPINLPPIAVPTTATAIANTPSTIQLSGLTANPNSQQTLTYELLSQPTHGTISSFDPQTGTLVYTPTNDYLGPDSLQFRVHDMGDPGPSLTSDPATLTLNVQGGNTGAVRLIGRTLVVTPPPRADSQPNTIAVSQENGKLIVRVNSQIDAIQPAPADVDRLVLYGSKTSDTITVAPDVTVPATIDGGHGGSNMLRAGGASSLMHGWFGVNTMVGSPQDDQLIGRIGRVHFLRSGGNDQLFTGVPRKISTLHQFGQAPGGTFYRFVNDRLVPIPTPTRHTAALQARAAQLSQQTQTVQAQSIHPQQYQNLTQRPILSARPLAKLQRFLPSRLNTKGQ